MFEKIRVLGSAQMTAGNGARIGADAAGSMARPRRRLTLLLAAAASANLAAACASPEQKLERYTSSGLEFLEEGEIQKANIQFRNALKINEEHVPALVGLYKVMEETGEPRQMFGLLQQIVRLDPRNIEAQIDLSKIILLSGDEAASLERVDSALEIDPENGEAIGVKSAILFRMGDRDEAIRLAGEALEKDPSVQEAATVIATDHIMRNELDEALKVVDAAIAASPKAAVLHLLRVQLFSSQGRETEIGDAYEALIAEFPDEPGYRRLYVTHLFKEEKFSDARAQLEEVIRARPKEIEGYLDIARLDRFTDGDEKARATLDAYAAGRPGFPELTFAYAAFLRQTGSEPEAIKVYERLADDAKSEDIELRARNELAAIALLSGDRAGAEALIADILKRDERNSDALIKTASIKLMDDDAVGAINDLRLVLADDPGSVPAKLLMGSAYEATGEKDSAERQYTEAFDASDDKSTVGNAFARFLVREGKLERAETILDQALAVDRSHEENLKLLAAVRLQRQDWRGAEEAAKLIADVQEDDTLVNRILGAAYTGLRDYAGAIEVLERMNEDDPLAVGSLTTLVNAYVQGERIEDAERLLRDNIAKGVASYESTILLSQVLFGSDRSDEGTERLRSAIGLDPARPAAYERLYRIYFSEGRRDDAEAILEEGMRNAPGNDGMKVLRADLHMANQEFEEAIAVYADILTRRPGDLLVSNNYAALISDLRDDKASLERAVEVSLPLADTDNANFLDTHGWALVRAGRLAEGVSVLDRAVGLAPDLPDALFHLGAAQLQAGDVASGQRNLRKAIDIAGTARPDIASKAGALLDE